MNHKREDKAYLNVTVNNFLQKGLSRPLMESRLGNNDITGGFGSITPLNTFTQSIKNIGAFTDFFLNS
jgi:hypothetical protein